MCRLCNGLSVRTANCKMTSRINVLNDKNFYSIFIWIMVPKKYDNFEER